jgi:hypothetical protein
MGFFKNLINKFQSKKEIIYSFRIEDMDKNLDKLEKLEASCLELGAFPHSLNIKTKEYVIYLNYFIDPITENPLFSVNKMTLNIKKLGFKRVRYLGDTK